MLDSSSLANNEKLVNDPLLQNVAVANSGSTDKKHTTAAIVDNKSKSLDIIFPVIVETLKEALRGSNLFSVSTEENLYVIAYSGNPEEFKGLLIKALEVKAATKGFITKLSNGKYDLLIVRKGNKTCFRLPHDDEGLKPFVTHIQKIAQLKVERETLSTMALSINPTKADEATKRLEEVNKELAAFGGNTVCVKVSVPKNDDKHQQGVPAANASSGIPVLKEQANSDNKNDKKGVAGETIVLSSESKALLQNLYQNANNVLACTSNKKKENTWASSAGINQFLEKILLGSSVEVIHPDLSSRESPAAAKGEEALQGAVNYIKTINALLKGKQVLDRPIIMIINTKSVEMSDAKDYTALGGSHWQPIVILPKSYTNPLGIVINNDREKVFFIDSLYPTRVIPPLLEQFLKQGLEYTFEAEGLGKVTHKVPALCVNGEFINCAVPQQSGAEDCGWWAVYNALMFVLTGKDDFLKQFKERSREPGYVLRGLFPNLENDVNAVKTVASKKPNDNVSSDELMAIKKAMEESLKVVNNTKSKAIDNKTKIDVNPDQDAKSDVKSNSVTIAEDNTDYGYPTDFVHGLLAAHISEESGAIAGKSLIKDGDAVEFKQNPGFLKMFKEQDQLVIKGYLSKWKVCKIIEDAQTGYLGILYVNETDKQIVLSHRPTHFALALTKNIVKGTGMQADVESVVMGRIVMHQAYGYLATIEATKYAKEKGLVLSVTGHSLGAWLAELSVFYCNIDLKYPYVKGVTFDGPGSLEMMEQMHAGRIRGASDTFKLEHLDVVTYVSAPNLVNSASKHIGTIYRLFPQITETVPLPVVANKLIGLKNVNALLATCGHDIKYILPHFDVTTGNPSSDAKCRRVVKWPSVTHKEFGHSEESLFSKHAKEVMKEILGEQNLLSKALISLGSKIGDTILSKSLSNEATTMGSVVYVLRDMANGKIKQEQFWKVHEFLDKKQGYDVKADTTIMTSFELLYKGQYKVEEISHLRVAVDPIDRYLVLLKQKENELAFSNLPGEVYSKVKWLVAQYDYKASDKCLEISKAQQGNITPDMLRGTMVRLLLHHAADIENFVNSEIKPGYVVSYSDLKHSDIKFSGRKTELEKIKKGLDNKEIVVITGMPGVGKTKLAQECERQYKNQNIVVRSIVANSQIAIASAYKNLAAELGLDVTKQDDKVVMNIVHSKILENGKETLFIFDNVESKEDIALYVENLPKNVRLLVTSRHKKLLESTSIEIAVEPFTKKEAEDYLNQNIKGIAQADIDLLLKELGSIPQHLSLFIGYYKLNGFSTVQDFITAFRKDNKSIFKLVLDRLFEDYKVAWEVLQYLAWLNPDFIPLNEDILQKIGAKYSKDQIWQALKVLESLSLIEVVGEFNARGIRIHREVQEQCFKYATINPLKALKVEDLVKDLLQILDSLFPIVTEYLDRDWEIARLLQPNLIIIFGYAETRKVKIPQDATVASLYLKLGQVYGEMLGKLNEALKYHKIALEIWQALHQSSNIDVAASFHHIGHIYNVLGNPKEALKYFEQALKMRQERFQGNHYDIADTLNSIGYSYDILGNAKEALKYYKKALAMRQALYLKETHSDIAQSYNNIGSTYNNLRNAKEAVKYLEQALKIQQEPFQGDRLLIAATLSNLGIAYNALGNAKEALKYFEQALKLRQELFQGNHPHIAISLSHIGNAYHIRRDAKEALKYYEQALKMQQELFQGNHPDIAVLLSNLGQVYNLLINAKEALKYYEQALKMRQELFLGNHPDIADILNCIGCSYNIRGNAEEALKYFKQALKMQQEFFQDNHPKIAASLISIAYTYYTLGNAKEALKYLEQALKMQQELFQGNHCDIAGTLNILSNLYQAIGDIGKSTLYHKQAEQYKLDAASSTFISKRGMIADNLLKVKIKIQAKVLNKIQKLAAEGTWTYKYITGIYDWGVTGYLDYDYLKKQLGELGNYDNYSIALMLCFEAISIGIINSSKKDVECAKKFAEAYPRWVISIAHSHPELFVDELLARTCISDHQLLALVIAPAHLQASIANNTVVAPQIDSKDAKNHDVKGL